MISNLILKLTHRSPLDRVELTGIGITLLAASVFIFDAHRTGYPWLCHDGAIRLYLGREILAGARLYVDWFDPNPPAIYFFAALLVSIGDLIQISEIWLFTGSIFGLSWMGVHTLGDIPRCSPSSFSLGKKVKTTSVSAFDLYFNLSAVVWLILLWPGFSKRGWDFEFGECEQIFTLLFVPFLYSRVYSFDNNRYQPINKIYSLTLGYFSTLKPQFMIMVGIVEVFYLAAIPRVHFSMRSFWKNYSILLMGMVAPIFLLAWHSFDSVVALFTVMIPSHSEYASFNWPRSYFFRTLPNWVVLSSSGIGVLLLVFCKVKKRIHPRGMMLVCLIVLLNYLFLILQGKFYAYHFIPIFGVNLGMIVYCLTILLKGNRAGLFLSIALGALVCSGLVQLADHLRIRPGRELVTPSQFTREDKIMYFSMRTQHVRQVVQLGLKLVGPWFHYFTLPGILKNADHDVRQKKMSLLKEQLYDRIRRDRPDYLIFGQGKWGLEKSIFEVLTEEVGFLIPSEYIRLSGEGSTLFFLRKNKV